MLKKNKNEKRDEKLYFNIKKRILKFRKKGDNPFKKG